MSFFGGFMDTFFPGAALNHEIKKQRLARMRSLYSGYSNNDNFEATAGGRTQHDFLNPHTDADSAIAGNNDKLRRHVRQLEYNNGDIAGPIQRFANYIIGSGLRFQARVTADKKYTHMINVPRISETTAEGYNFWLEKRIKIWNKQADVHLMMTGHEMQRLIQMTLIRDGEAIIIGRKSRRPARLIPYCQEIVEIDRLQTPPGLIADPRVRNGIRYDEEGVPETYYILKHHPGNTIQPHFKFDDFEEVPAWNKNGTKKVLHLFEILRPEQTRGFTWLAAGLKDIQNTVRYKDAELVAALEDACMTGIVKSTAPQTFQNNYTKTGARPNGAEKRINRFAPNKWHYLNPYEDVEIRGPSRPNDHFDEIINAFSRGPANALNIPPEVWTQNWRDLNYSNARTILISFYQVCRIKQKYFVDHYSFPTHENVVPYMVAGGHVLAPAFDRRREDYLAAEYIPPARDWVDPKKEAEGKTIDIANLTETGHSVCASLGKDYDENLEIRAKELKRIKEYEEEYGISFSRDGIDSALKKNDSAEEEEEEEKEEEKATSGKKAKVIKLKK